MLVFRYFPLSLSSSLSLPLSLHTLYWPSSPPPPSLLPLHHPCFICDNLMLSPYWKISNKVSVIVVDLRVRIDQLQVPIHDGLAVCRAEGTNWAQGDPTLCCPAPSLPSPVPEAAARELGSGLLPLEPTCFSSSQILSLLQGPAQRPPLL